MSCKAEKKHPDWLLKPQYVRTLVCTLRLRTPGLGCSAMAGMFRDVDVRGMPVAFDGKRRAQQQCRAAD
jgi:hypothetical protein